MAIGRLTAGVCAAALALLLVALPTHAASPGANGNIAAVAAVRAEGAVSQTLIPAAPCARLKRARKAAACLSRNARLPAPVITAGPSGTATTTTARFAFRDVEAHVSYQCLLDGGVFAACRSPITYSEL